jgi:hypothetical protein
MRDTKYPVVAFSTRNLRQDLADELRLMRVRQHATIESVLNDALAIGLRVLKKRELRERRK